jgi:hypothetical protein
MDPDAIAPLIAMFMMCVTVGGILVLRPLSKRVGELLGAMAQDRKGERTSDAEVAQLRATLESVNARMALLEDRLDFTERLLSDGNRHAQREPADRTSGR